MAPRYILPYGNISYVTLNYFLNKIYFVVELELYSFLMKFSMLLNMSLKLQVESPRLVIREF